MIWLPKQGRGFMNEQKTKLQLEALILERARATMELEDVTVLGAGTQWQATFSAKPHLMMAYSALFRAIIAEMHELYDLHREA
jgi:hypothetical protein